MKKVIILAGPTASGKSEISIALSLYFDLEIVSADSMAIYKYMDIGTDKPPLSKRALVKHYMIDVVEPVQDYSVYLYSEKAKKIIDSLHKAKKIPIVVGGTGLYIESLFYSVVQTFPNPELRKKLYELEAKNPGILYERLRSIDPEMIPVVDPHNIKRLVRAIEIYETTGKLPSVVRKISKNNKTDYKFLKLYIDKDRKKLYNSINERVDRMIKEGLIEETSYLLENEKFGPTSSKAIGYRETISFLKGEVDFNNYIFLLKRNSRRYAKRQISWFKRYKDFYRISNLGEAVNLIKLFIERG